MMTTTVTKVACPACHRGAWCDEPCPCCKGTGVAKCDVCSRDAVTVVDGSTYVCAACNDQELRRAIKLHAGEHPAVDVQAVRDEYAQRLWDALMAGDYATAADLMDTVLRANNQLKETV